MTLKSKLLAAAAFDHDSACKLAMHHKGLHGDSPFVKGNRAENARLLPLLTAMAKVCEAADKIKYKLDHNSGLELVWAIKELRKMVEK